MFPPILILPLKVGEPPAKRPKPNRGQGNNWKDEKKNTGEKREKREREALGDFQNNLHSVWCFLFKKNEKGMMEKGRESDKFNDVCSKLRLEK